MSNVVMLLLEHYKVGQRSGQDLQNNRYVNRVEAAGADHMFARPAKKEHRFFCRANVRCGSLSPGFC